MRKTIRIYYFTIDGKTYIIDNNNQLVTTEGTKVANPTNVLKKVCLKLGYNPKVVNKANYKKLVTLFKLKVAQTKFAVTTAAKAIKFKTKTIVAATAAKEKIKNFNAKAKAKTKKVAKKVKAKTKASAKKAKARIKAKVAKW